MGYKALHGVTWGYMELHGHLVISDFENPSDSDSTCLFVYAFINYTVKKSTFQKKIPKFQLFLS
jgi:hypothetical protein